MSTVILKASRFLTRRTGIFYRPKRFRNRPYVIKTEELESTYGGRTNITVLPGVGIGPEITERTLEVLQAAQAPLYYEILTLPPKLEFDDDDEEFENALISIRRNRVALKGNLEARSKKSGAMSRNVLLRKNLNLYAFVVHCKTIPTLRNHFGNFDVIIVRENTEGEYLMLEHVPKPKTIESLKVITRYTAHRIAKYAFEYAVRMNRKHLMVVHTAQVLQQSEGMFLNIAFEVAKDYPEITVEALDVGVAAHKLVMNPKKFDVILASNLNGSILSNILIGMMGGPGLVAGTNFGDDRMAIFEPAARNRGAGTAGQGIASPVAMILAAINLLEYLGYRTTAMVLQSAVYYTLTKDKIRTHDVGGKATSREITDRIIFHIKRLLNPTVHGILPGYEEIWNEYCKLSVLRGGGLNPGEQLAEEEQERREKSRQPTTKVEGKPPDV